MTLPAGAYLSGHPETCEECETFDQPMGYDDKKSGDFYQVCRNCGHQWVALTAEEQCAYAEERMKDALRGY